MFDSPHLVIAKARHPTLRPSSNVGRKEGSKIDEFMIAALDEAQRGSREGGIPIGSVLVKGGRIIGRGHNKRVQKGNPILHAEIDCLQDAGRLGKYGDTV